MARYQKYDISEIEDLFRRVEVLEARVAALEGGSPLPPVAEPQIDSQITELLRQGRKLEAIKVYQDQTGVGLAEAKAAVEQLAGLT